MAEEKDWKTEWCERWDGEEVTIDGEEFLQKKDSPSFAINIYQYELLKECSDKRNIDIWNKYRKNNPDREILLCGAELQNQNLNFIHLQKADLRFANLCNTLLWEADLREANLSLAHLEQNNSLLSVNLKGAHLYKTRFNDSVLDNANLEQAKFIKSCIESAKFLYCNLEKTKLETVKMNSRTDFTGSNIDSALIAPSIKDSLEYNIRRLRWHDWYQKGHWSWRWLKQITRWFWSVSDYGISSTRIIGWFLAFSIVYACFYWLFSVQTLSGMKPYDFCHALYFSVVTMTTLGFGDIHAAKDSHLGQIILITQVTMGYVLLGALVTRLGVVFTGLGPVEKPKLAKEEKWTSILSGIWLILIPAALIFVICLLAPIILKYC